MITPTWGDLINCHCTLKWLAPTASDADTVRNPFYEDMATRRYNYAASDASGCRLVFLKKVLDTPGNKTLVRHGRFIWCRNLKYEGRGKDGSRHLSFTVDRGQKRFTVSEHNVLCIPASTFINNNRFFRQKGSTFKGFSSVFAYAKTLNMMRKNSDLDKEDFLRKIHADNPHKPGALVGPRLGYFYPSGQPSPTALATEHPCGIIIGPSFDNSDYAGREFYRVKFGDTTYERVHPIQLEIINEV